MSSQKFIDSFKDVDDLYLARKWAEHEAGGKFNAAFAHQADVIRDLLKKRAHAQGGRLNPSGDIWIELAAAEFDRLRRALGSNAAAIEAAKNYPGDGDLKRRTIMSLIATHHFFKHGVELTKEERAA